MEQDFNEKHWSNPCPKYDCRKAACKCGLEYVNIPASLGDDSEGSDVAPKNGAYCNALVIYEANNHVYIYSKEGVPTLIDVDASDISTLEQEVRKAQKDIVEFREELNEFIHGYDTVLDMRNATNLSNGDYAETLGYNSKNDNRGALYKIRNIASGETADGNTLISLNNINLVAELVGNSEIINNLKQPTTTSFTVGQGKTLTGTHSVPINAGAENIVISVTGNNATIDNISITNTNSLSNKTAIKAYNNGGNTAGMTISNTTIGANFDKGIVLDSAYFSSFSNIRIGNTDNASLTLDNSSGNWTGVQNFRDCIFHSGSPTVLINESDTNTISFDNCCFEDVTNNVIENKGTIYVNRSYFGDMRSTNKETHLLRGYSGSKTYFNDCTLSITPAKNTVGNFNTHFDLHDGSECHVRGGLIYAGNRNYQSAVYSSNSSSDKIFIDGLRENNANDWTPYYLYPYTPLCSENPMYNYIINGTLTDNLQTKIGYEASDGTVKDFTINSNYVNPFGGNVVEHTQIAVSNPYLFYYEVPDSYVGKEMIMQVYGYCKRDTGDTSVPFSVYSYDMSARSDLSNNFGFEPFNQYSSNSEFDSRNVFANQKVVYPKKKRGVITVQYQATGNGFISISGIALLDKSHSLQMGTFVSADKRASTHIPTNTSDATKGDFVYNFNSSPTCEGWLFDGTSWNVINAY